MTTAPSPAAAPSDQKEPHADAFQATQSQVAGRQRPAGEQGGHTVQDWEQPEATSAVASSSRLDEASQHPVAEHPGMTPIGGEPSPEVVPIYLRKGAKGRSGSKTTAPAAIAVTQQPAEPDETLVDAISRSVLALLAPVVRESVKTAVQALAPKMNISLAPSREATRQSSSAEASSPEDSANDDVSASA